MQWKQWYTDDSWSAKFQILQRHEICHLGGWRPAPGKMEFPSGGQVILDWLSKLEAWCAAQPVGSAHLGLHAEFAWLRAAVRHQLPGTYAPGKQVEDML